MEDTTKDIPDFDATDFVSLVTSLVTIGAFVSGGASLVVAFPVLLAYAAQHYGRRTEAFQHLIRDKEFRGKELVGRALLPPPKQEITNNFNSGNFGAGTQINNDQRPFWERIQQSALQNDQSMLTGVLEQQTALKQQQRLLTDVKRLPRYISYKQLDTPPSKLSVPIGYSAEDKRMLWGDFGKDTDDRIMHALVAGYTGSGKDALLRLWYTTLTANNTPEEIQFVFIDGKVDWLSPALADSAYMARPPAGGMELVRIKGKLVDCAVEKMQENLDWIFDELHRRQQLFAKAGATDIDAYRRKTHKNLPMIFFVATDVGETFTDDLNKLVTLLSMRGRAYGIRLIISMQNPVGEGSKWKSQIGLIVTGHQPNPDHDRYVLGINVGIMKYRPSMLPNPEENNISQGLFIMKRGSQQKLIRTPHLPESDWETYIETVAARKSTQNDDFLAALMEKKPEGTVTRPLAIPKILPQEKAVPVLTKDQALQVAQLTLQGKNKSEIMYTLKFTNAAKYKEASPTVDKIIRAVKEKQHA